MAIKIFEDESLGTIRVSKRSGSRNLRLSIAADGEIRVTIPAWTPYKSGLDFAVSKTEWILSHAPKQGTPLQAGHTIGKAHRLVFTTATIDIPSSRIAGTEIKISRPLGMAPTHPEVQKVAKRASIRALRTQAESLLPQRLKQLAEKNGFTYASVSVKQLKGRWGSCDNNQNIVLNLFLMQLPWHLIDYVILHELIHTKHLNHGSDFWDEFLKHQKLAKTLRKEIKSYKPVLVAGDSKPAVT